MQVDDFMSLVSIGVEKLIKINGTFCGRTILNEI